MRKLCVAVGLLALLFAMPMAAQKGKPTHTNQPAHLSRPAQAKPEKQAKPERATQASRKETQQNQHTKSLQDRANTRNRGHETLSARNDRRIPDAQFRNNFGSGHRFRVNIGIYGGNSGFMYGGFQFGFLEPWPMGWGVDDSCYIDYLDGGYFLFDPLFPGARIAVVIN